MPVKTRKPRPTQVPLCDDLDPGPAAPQVPAASSIRFLGREKELTKEQKAFNRLTSRIRSLEARIAKAERDHLALDQDYANRYRPVLDALGASVITLALRIEDTAGRNRPSKNVKRMLKQLMPSMLKEAFDLVEPTPEALALHDKYSRQNYRAMVEEQEAAMGEIFLDLLEDLGAEVPQDVRANAHDPKVMDSFADDFLREIDEEMAQATKSRPRKKTRKQIEREQLEQQKEQLKQRGLRDIYIALAKVLHPDTELDPERKLQKEAFIKRVTVAYDEGNLVELLHLEAEWLETSGLQEASQDKLPLYIEILKDQVKNLEVTCFHMENRYRDTYGTFEFSIAAFRRTLDRTRAEAEQETGRMKRLLARLEEDPYFLEPCLSSLLGAS